jgi:hypothetical protein
VCDRLGVAQALEQARQILLVLERAKELAMDQSRRVAQKVLGVVVAHYPNLDKEVVGEGWPPGLPDEVYEGSEAEAAPFAERMVTNAADELGLFDDPAGGTGPGDGAGDAALRERGLLDSAAGGTSPRGGAEGTPAQE